MDKMDKEEYLLALKEVKSLKPTWKGGLIFIILTYTTTISGIFFASQTNQIYWLGQLLLILAFTQHFILMHEAGHNTLTPNSKFNNLIGHISSVMAIIPFISWRAIHRQHHHLTGWKNEDPTTKIQVDPKVTNLNLFQKFINRWCWRLWIPFFSTMYRAGTYWNFKAINLAIINTQVKVKIILNIILLILFYFTIFKYFGFHHILSIFGISLYISLSLMEIILLSQHNHIPMSVSKGKFHPHTFYEQVAYTRSLSCPFWLESCVLFYFNRHEMHHCFPSLPSYYFKNYNFKFQNTWNIWSWTIKVKKMDAVDLIFKDSSQTGVKV